MGGMIARNHVFTVELNEGLKRYPLGSLLAEGNALADSILVALTKGGEEVPLDGCAVMGYMIRPDDVTIKVPGSGTGSIASVTLPREAYAYGGAFSLAVNVSSAEITQTVAVFDGRIVRTQTDNVVVDSGTVVPNLDDLLAQISRMEQATQAALDAAQHANGAADKMPVVGDNGNWYVWDYASGAYVDSGSPSTGLPGPQGVSITNAVINADGYLILTFSNGNSINAGRVNAQEGAGADGIGIQEIRKTGTNGLIDTYTITYTNGGTFEYTVTNGKDGTPCTHSFEGTVLTMTSASGTSSADLKGEKGNPGDKGDPGENGKTPVKGVDYFTSVEKAEMVNEVKAQIDVSKASVLTIDGVDYTMRTGTEGAEGFITFVLEEGD